MKWSNAVAAVLVLGLSFGARAADDLAVTVVSSDPARVTGGDALIAVTGGSDITATLNGADVSKAFAKDGARRIGLVTGLKTGANDLVVKSGGQSKTVKLTNYPITGPVFAGPKEKPFYCETQRFELPDGTKLGPSQEPNCSIATKVSWYYKPKEGGEFKELPSMKALPGDVAMTTTSTGKTVPFVVRVETGTIDRGIYQIAVLNDPTTDEAPSLTHPSKNWNGRMAYLHYGGCGGEYRQGARIASGKEEKGVLDPQFVGRGYMTMGNTLNVLFNNCDDLLASEAAMMTHEHAVKEFGKPVFTIGWGCSGGSHQVLQTADNYPGIFDGIMPLCDSVDHYRLLQGAADMTLMHNWYEGGGKALTDEQKIAAQGALLDTSLASARLLDPTDCEPVVPKGTETVVPKELIYNAKTNPKGIRCTQAEHTVNSTGRDPATGQAWLTFDNVGVQYGLGALNDKKISVAQFLDLNEQVGGFDADGKFTAKRSVGQVKGIENAYRTGRVLNGGGGLKDTPVLEQRNYSDRDHQAGHLKSATYATLARLDKVAGNHDNYVVLLESHRNGDYAASRQGDEMSAYAIAKMDEWLTKLVADKAPGTQRERVLRDKPADLVDSCYDGEGARIVEKQTFTGGKCNQLYPAHPTPRMVAGTVESQDVLKCALKPVDMKDYKVTLSADEQARLKKIFDGGVCDWTKPSVGAAAYAGPWQTF